MEKHEKALNLDVSVSMKQGGRSYMEDCCHIVYQDPDETTERKYAFFGVFDGHAGEEASSFVQEHLVKEITKLPGFSSHDDDAVLESIKTGFLNCNELLKAELIKLGKLSKEGRFTEESHSRVGTTAIVMFLREHKVFIGHAGDSRIVLGYKDPSSSDNSWKAKQLTKDHKPHDPDELARIELAGGKIDTKTSRVIWSYPTGHFGSDDVPLVDQPRFDGKPFYLRALNMSRSLGNFWSFNEETQEYIVSAVPDVSVLNIDLETHKCIILATDGLWDDVSSEEAVKEMRFVQNINWIIDNAQTVSSQLDRRRRLKYEPAGRLTEVAITKCSVWGHVSDNITVIAMYIERKEDLQETP